MDKTPASENDALQLRKIIAVLINQLSILKKENDILQLRLMINELKNANAGIADSEKNQIYTNAKNEDMQKTSLYTNPENEHTAKQLFSTNAKNEHIIKLLFYTYAKILPVIKHLIYTNAENGHGLKTSFYTNAESEDMIKKLFSLMSENEPIVNEIFSSKPENEHDIHYQKIAIPDSEAILNDIFMQQPEILQGIKSVLFPMAEKEPAADAEKTEVKKIAPAFIEINNENVSRVINKMRSFFAPSAKYAKRANVAKELLWLYNNGMSGSDALRKIAGLSKAGFAKHLPTLHRSGMVTKHGYNKYTLSEPSLKALIDQFGVEAKEEKPLQ